MIDTCGHPTADDNPCQHPASEADGKCWQHTDANPSPGGQPSKLTLERQEEIAQAIERGKSDTVAARMAGITPRTFINWVERGQDEEEGPYADFFQRLTHAWGHGQNYWEKRLHEVTEDPATIMAILKTQYPDTEWGEAKRADQAGGVIIYTDDAEEYEIDDETLEAKRE